MLAATPPSLPEPPEQDPNWPEIYNHCELGLEARKTWRYSWWAHCALLAQFILPYRYHWFITANTMNRGRPVNDAILDSTPTLAMRICAAGMLEGLMSPSRPWFRIGVSMPGFEADSAAQQWLDDTTERVLSVLAGSNFYTEAAQMYEDLATFGTSPMIIYEDYEDVIRAYLPCAGEYCLSAGGRLSVDQLWREFTYTVTQIVDFFGLEACPNAVRELWQSGGANLEREFVVGHVIEPNYRLEGRGRGKDGAISVVSGRFPYREIYWLRGYNTGAPLAVRGFNEKPFIAMRWSKTSNDPYGRGPGMDALPDSKQLQQETLRKGQVIDQIAQPSMGADPEMKNQPSSIIPGEVTYVNTSEGKKGFWRLFDPNPQALPALKDDIQEVQRRIDRAFYVDVFMMISQMEGVQPRNELEILERKGEKIQRLGPVIELAEVETKVAIERVAAIMARRGLLRPRPPSLQGVPVDIEYISQMKLMQRAAQTAGIERVAATAARLSEGAMAAGLRPPLRILNLDKLTRIYAEDLGYPAAALYTTEEVEQQDEAKDQASAANQALAATVPAVQAAEGLGKIDVGGGQSAIQAMLGTGPGTAAGPVRV